jgi:DNA-binding GntR family transcriptional regulator
VHVLADRVASALVHHEPGWRLPRRSALARRYGVSPAEMEAAIEELAARNLLRRLPDGQVYRASPADYLIRLEGLNDLRASIDPMGSMIECASRHVSLRRVPEDIGGALGLAPGEPVSMVRCLWTSAGNPAAFSATYLPEHLSFLSAEPTAFADALKPPRVASPEPDHNSDAGEPAARQSAHPAGLYVELQPPAPSVARSLRLAAGQPAVNVTVRFDAVPAGGPMALATAVLRSDMFRVVVESPQAPRVSGLTGEDDVLWTRTAEGWEP